VRSDVNGDWKIVFDALPASAEGRELTVSGDDQKRTLRDVLVGEVWVCAGQSNMEFPLRGEATAPAALAEADIPNLRLNLWRFATQYVYATPFTKAQAERLTPERFYENQWQASSAQSARDFSAIGWFFGREIQQRLGVPVGMISLAAGGSPTEAWIRRAALQADPQLRSMVEGNWLDNKTLDDWCRERGHQNLDKPLTAGPMPGDDLGTNHPFKPSFLWEAGMARLIPFALRGVLWYQGESNSLAERRVQQHEQLFPLLVQDWRAAWRQSDLPFYFVQLSGIATERGYKSHFWPQFRDQQRRLAQGTGVSLDGGLH
jgi:sialate O-acetylesterase